MKTIKQALLVLATTIVGLTALALIPSAGAALLAPTDVPESISGAIGGQTDLKSLILTIIDYALGFLGLIAVIMVIYGGVLYVTSAGDSGKTDTAKKIILYTVIGIIIIMLSFVLVNAVLGAGSGSTVTTPVTTTP